MRRPARSVSDRQLLNAVKRLSRCGAPKVSELARAVNLDPSSVNDRIRRLSANGLLRVLKRPPRRVALGSRRLKPGRSNLRYGADPKMRECGRCDTEWPLAVLARSCPTCAAIVAVNGGGR